MYRVYEHPLHQENNVFRKSLGSNRLLREDENDIGSSRKLFHIMQLSKFKSVLFKMFWYLSIFVRKISLGMWTHDIAVPV